MTRVHIKTASVDFTLESTHALSKTEESTIIAVFSNLNHLKSENESFANVFTRLDPQDQLLIKTLQKSGVFPETISIEDPFDHLFAAIHLDHITGDSHFAGGLPARSLNYLANELEKLGNTGLATLYRDGANFDAALQKTQNPKELEEFCNEFKKTLSKMGDGDERFLTGVYPNPPHGIFFKIKKNNNGLYSFSVYNSGDGLYNHPERVIEGKLKHQLAMTYEPISEETLLNSPFLFRLFELSRKHVFDPQGKRVGTSMAYDLLKTLGPPINQTIPYMSDQTGGGCFWNGILPHLQLELGFEAYKKFKFHVKCDSFETYLQKKDHFFIEDPDRIYLLQEASKKFSSSVLKIEHLLSDEELEKAEKLCKEGRERAHHLRKKLVKSIKVKEEKPLSTPLSPPELFNDDILETHISPFVTIDKTDTFTLNAKKLLETSKALLSQKTQSIRALKRWLIELDHLCVDLPMPNDHTQFEFNLIYDLIDAMTKTTLVTQELPAKSIITFVFLQVLAHHSASQEFPELKNTSTACGLTPLMRSQGLFLLKDPKWDLKKEQIITYLNKPSIFSYLSQTVIDVETYENPERPFLTEDSITKKANALYKHYNTSKKPQEKHIEMKDFEKIAIFEGFEEIYPEKIALLKRISCASFMINTMETTAPSHSFVNNTLKQFFYIFGPPNRNRFYASLSKIEDPESFDLRHNKTEANVAISHPKHERHQKSTRLKELFRDPNTRGFRLRLILNTLLEDLSLFTHPEIQTLFESYAFCVDGSTRDEMEKSQETIKLFLTNGFNYFSKNLKEIETACFFLRLDHAFSNYLGHTFLNLETAVQDDEVMQDFESEQFPVGGDHSQKVKAPPTGSSYGSKDCVNASSSTAVS